MRRFEIVLTAFFLATWIVSFLALIGLVDVANRFSTGLYPLFGIAAGGGWIFGNVYVLRARPLPDILRRGLFVIYYLGPLGSLFLLRAMATKLEQAAAPFVPLYSWAVFSVLFLVPVVLRRVAPGPPAAPGPPDLNLGDRDREK